ncbi:MFS transporter [Mycobacterium sp. MS1601]|uniref:MFS transporter n=1 Tax=Mycobacterium sp. MS1601 TaxID=1936029 RepID=UPI0009791DF0|nr:MFS transporter [Mycobacterium sp. MS1601]AQA05146.1 MFS transporter [Mycobacterium sp. MS1601]
MTPIAAAYLGSHFLSFLGNGILAVALPLIVLQATGSPASVGVISAATAVPALLVGLAAGVVIDRVNRRTCSMLSDVVSAAAVAAIPVVDLVWGLDLTWLVALAIIGAFGDVPGLTARQVMVPAVARHAGVPLERLVGLRQSMTSMALVIGPGAAGTLLALFDGTTVLWVTAATSAAAVLLTAALPHRLGAVESDRQHRQSLLRQLGAGAVELRRSRFLTGTVTLTVGLAVAIGGLQGLVLPLYFSDLARPDLLGFVLTALAVGMLIGTSVFALTGTRMSRRFWVSSALIGTTAGFLAMATLASPPVVFAGAGLFGIANASLGAVVGVLQAERIADAVRGRVLSVQNACLQIAAPAGIALAAVVAEYGSAVAAGVAVFAVWLVLVGVVAVSRTLTDLEPQPAEQSSPAASSSGTARAASANPEP